MKKLLTAMIVSLVAGAVLADVVSQNIVGYQVEESNGEFRTLSVKFRAIGAGDNEFDITSVIDGNSVAAYTDLLEAYDPYDGFLDFLWDGTGWIDALTFDPVQINVVPGNSFLMLGAGAWTTLGEVASTTTYDHVVPLSEFCYVGNAFPAAQTLANFDWSNAGVYSDLLETYDPYDGFLDYMWDGTGWIDALTFDSVPISTPVEGFLFLTDTVSTLTQRLTPPYYN